MNDSDLQMLLDEAKKQRALASGSIDVERSDSIDRSPTLELGEYPWLLLADILLKQ